MIHGRHVVLSLILAIPERQIGQAFRLAVAGRGGITRKRSPARLAIGMRGQGLERRRYERGNGRAGFDSALRSDALAAQRGPRRDERARRQRKAYLKGDEAGTT